MFTTHNKELDDSQSNNNRTTYSSWGKPHLNMSTEKAWSLEESGSDREDGGHVEKSIKEALNGHEPSTRSRKTSHSLRFFKEGLTPDEARIKETRNRSYLKDANSSNKSQPLKHSGRLQPRSSYEFEVAKHNRALYDTITEDAVIIPRRLIDEESLDLGGPLDKGSSLSSHLAGNLSQESLNTVCHEIPAVFPPHHDVAPSDDKSNSFSKVPSIDTGWSNANYSNNYPHNVLRELCYKNDQNRNISQSRSDDDDEDSGEEQISSALFLPHQMAQESNGISGERLDLTPKPPHQKVSRSDEWFEEHFLSHDNRETNKFQKSQSQSVVYRDETQEKSAPAENSIPMSTRGSVDILQESRDEKLSRTVRTKNLSEDDDTTPTASPRSFSIDNEKMKIVTRDHQPVVKKPLEAIELIPYRHQVGGHTTLWRFSKRAVCKQLNNRENEFYERIEQQYPQLLRFLPRYIGVLNVTFEKQNRRGPSKKDTPESVAERLNTTQKNPALEVQPKFANSCSSGGKPPRHTQLDHRRVKSHSCTSQPQSVPTVTFADNRHIIPTSILKPRPLFRENQSRSLSESASFRETIVSDSSNVTININLSRTPAEPNPWGKTHVNKVLRDDVFKEVFLQKPIPIRHRKPANNRAFQYCNTSSLRSFNSESNLQAAQQSKPHARSPLQNDVKVSLENPSQTQPVTGLKISDPDNSKFAIGSELDLDNHIGRSAPEPQITYSETSNSTKRQRRYSSGGLRRRAADVADDRGTLQYFEEADDVICKDNTEKVFLMNTRPADPNSYFSKSCSNQRIVEKRNSIACLSKSTVKCPLEKGEQLHDNSYQQVEVPRPVNPKEARAQPGSRVEYFLLLEDLTAGMKRPCIMDLKMGTRQYGVDANYKKQKSQREKCAATTSKNMGVRVCGLQVWDVTLKDYIFEDKYYGRDLKAGDEFQRALTRFLYDGTDYSSVLRHIPSIIQKLSELEVLIKRLIGYRFYGTSLLMFYDGVIEEEYSSDSTATGKDDHSILRDVDFKIADFANCVTKEDFLTSERTCPPQYPKKPDMGFLRGLKTLKRYFLQIERDIRKEKGYGDFQTLQGVNGFNNLEDLDDDEGNISF